MAELTNPERRMLRAMQKQQENWSLNEILDACDWTDQAVAVTAGHGLSNHGLVKMYESSITDVILGSEGVNAASGGLLEARLWDFIQSNPDVTKGPFNSF